MKEPKREDYPKGKAGTDAYNKARAKYVEWLRSQTNKQTGMDLPSIDLPGLGPSSGTRSPSDVEAKRWFKFVGAKAKKGTQSRKYYDDFVNALKNAGIPQKDWQSVWDDAIDWTQTYGSGSDGKPIKFLSGFNPSDYKDKDSSGPKYGTQKVRTETTTQYGPSNAADYINKNFEAEIGRTATKEEIDAYTKGVNAAAKKEPGIYEGFTTTTGPTKGASLGTTTSKGTQKTGFDPAIYAANFARSRPDFAESFATKNFLKIIEGLLKDPNSIGTVVE